MEKLIIDFLTSASELILANRVLGASSSNSAGTRCSRDFNLNFPERFNFKSKFPTEWSSSVHKILVLEFYLKAKTANGSTDSTSPRFLVEQWNFELSEPTDQKRKLTMESTEQLKLKLTVLLRTISTLNITLPLYRTFLQESNTSLLQDFELDSCIKFSFRLLENWHSIVHEEGLLSSFSNEDVVLPGRTFSFKVNYTKTLTFAQHLVKREMNLSCIQTAKLTGNRMMSGCKKRTRFLSEEIAAEPLKVGGIYRTTTESASKHISRPPIQESGYESSEFVQWTPRRRQSESGHSLIDSIFGALTPIETQKTPKFLFGKQRKISMEYQSRSSKEGTRDTNCSASSSDDEFHIVESEDDKVKKTNQHSELSPRCESPLFLNAFECTHTQTVDYSERRDSNFTTKPTFRLSKRNSQMESFMQKSSDDKVADILNCLENLRELDSNLHYVSNSTKKATKCIRTSHPACSAIQSINLIGKLTIQPDFDTKQINHFNEELAHLDEFYNELTSNQI